MCQDLQTTGTRSMSRDVSESPVYRYSFYVPWCVRISSLQNSFYFPCCVRVSSQQVLVLCPVMCQSLRSTGTRSMSRDVSNLQSTVLVLCPVICQSLQSTGTRSMSRGVSESPVFRYSFYFLWCFRVSSLQVLVLSPVMCQDLQSTGTRSMSRDVSESPV